MRRPGMKGRALCPPHLRAYRVTGNQPALSPTTVQPSRGTVSSALTTPYAAARRPELPLRDLHLSGHGNITREAS